MSGTWVALDPFTSGKTNGERDERANLIRLEGSLSRLIRPGRWGGGRGLFLGSPDPLGGQVKGSLNRFT